MPGKVQLVVLLDILDDLDNMRIIKTITSSGIVFEYKDPAANPLMRNQLLGINYAYF